MRCGPRVYIPRASRVCLIPTIQATWIPSSSPPFASVLRLPCEKGVRTASPSFPLSCAASAPFSAERSRAEQGRRGCCGRRRGCSRRPGPRCSSRRHILARPVCVPSRSAASWLRRMRSRGGGRLKRVSVASGAARVGPTKLCPICDRVWRLLSISVGLAPIPFLMGVTAAVLAQVSPGLGSIPCRVMQWSQRSSFPPTSRFRTNER